MAMISPTRWTIDRSTPTPTRPTATAIPRGRPAIATTRILRPIRAPRRSTTASTTSARETPATVWWTKPRVSQASTTRTTRTSTPGPRRSGQPGTRSCEGTRPTSRSGARSSGRLSRPSWSMPNPWPRERFGTIRTGLSNRTWAAGARARPGWSATFRATEEEGIAAVPRSKRPEQRKQHHRDDKHQ